VYILYVQAEKDKFIIVSDCAVYSACSADYYSRPIDPFPERSAKSEANLCRSVKHG